MQNLPRHARVALLYTGGLDSFIAYHFLQTLNYEVQPVRFTLGSRYDRAETLAITRLGIQAKSGPPLAFLGKYESAPETNANIPGRNLLLVMLAALVARPVDGVCLVAQDGEMHIPDKTPEFFRTATAALSQAYGQKITVFTPFSRMDKGEVVAWYLGKGLPIVDLRKTFSCYSPLHAPEPHDPSADKVWSTAPCTAPCGNCPACFRRAVALMLNGVFTPHEYAQNPFDSPTAQRYRERMNQGHYDVKRRERTARAFEMADTLKQKASSP